MTSGISLRSREGGAYIRVFSRADSSAAFFVFSPAYTEH